MCRSRSQRLTPLVLLALGAASACTRNELWKLEIPSELRAAETKTLVAAAFRDQQLEALQVLERGEGDVDVEALLPALVDADDTTLTVTLVGYDDPARILNLPVGDLFGSREARIRPLPTTNRVFTAELAPTDVPSPRPWRGGDTSALGRILVPTLPPACPDFSSNTSTDLDLRVVEPLEDGQLLIGAYDKRRRVAVFGRFEADGSSLRDAARAAEKLRRFPNTIGDVTDPVGDITDILRVGSTIHVTMTGWIARLDRDGEVIWAQRAPRSPNHIVATADGKQWYAASENTLFAWSDTSSVVRATPTPTTERVGRTVSLALRGDALYALVQDCDNLSCSGTLPVGRLFRRTGDTWTLFAALPESGADMVVDDSDLIVIGNTMLMRFRGDADEPETQPLPNVLVTVGIVAMLVISPGRYAILGNTASFALTSADISRQWCAPRTGTTRYFDDLAFNPTTGDLLLADDRTFEGSDVDPGVLIRISTR